jgi:hypothetical protein
MIWGFCRGVDGELTASPLKMEKNKLSRNVGEQLWTYAM